METMSKLFDIKLLECKFPLFFKIINRYQWEEPILTEKNYAEYKNGYFRGDRNTINLVTLRDEIVIPQLPRKYIVKQYRTYFLYFVLDRKEVIIFQHSYSSGTVEEPSIRKSQNATYANVPTGQY